MKLARSGLVAAALLVGSAVSGLADPAVISTRLNLRSGPGAAFGIVAMMPAGSRLDVQSCGEEWCRVKFGRQSGFANRALINAGADSYASATPRAAPAEPKPTMIGPTIWQWRNEEWRNENWRELDWHNRLNQR